MKKYYLSAIFLDMTFPFAPDGIWRHALQRYPDTPYAGGEIAVDAKTGLPIQKAMLVLVDVPDHGIFSKDVDLVPLPDVAIDDPITAKDDFKTAAKSIGLDAATVDASVDAAVSLRDVLEHFGALNNAEFDHEAEVALLDVKLAAASKVL